MWSVDFLAQRWGWYQQNNTDSFHVLSKIAYVEFLAIKTVSGLFGSVYSQDRALDVKL